MTSKYAKGTWVEHPTANWGKGVVLEDSDGPTAKLKVAEEEMNAKRTAKRKM